MIKISVRTTTYRIWFSCEWTASDRRALGGKLKRKYIIEQLIHILFLQFSLYKTSVHFPP